MERKIMTDNTTPERDFEKMTVDQVAEIINIAMDNGNWHTPSTSSKSIVINPLSSKVVRYGTCKISLHSNYHDEDYWFNINANSVHIWQDATLPGRSKTISNNIYNLRKLIELIDKYTRL